MNLNVDILVIGTGCSASAARSWLLPIVNAAAKYQIGPINPLAAFIANIGVESGGLIALVENLNYSAEGLAKTWPARYAVNPKATVLVPNSKALAIARKPELIANSTYANRMGNGSESSGDGWRYRGRGLMQVTGKFNYEALGKAIGVDLLSNPDRLSEPETAAISAAWFFATNGCIELAKLGKFDDVVKVINGKPPNKANHGDLRKSRYSACSKAMST